MNELNLYQQLCLLIGEPPNEIVTYLYYLVIVILLITSLKLIYTFIFRFVLGIKRM